MYHIKKLKYKNILNLENIQISNQLVTFITGESGSGKTTLLRLLHAETFDFLGYIEYKGKNITSYDTNKLRKEIGRISQDYIFYTQTIKEEFLYLHSLLKNKITDTMIQEFLTIVNLDLNINSNLETLSGGEKQRLAIARVLSTNKKVLLLDEITSSLDSSNSFKLMENLIIYSKKNEIKLIIISHNKEIVEKYGDEIIHIEKETDDEY